MIKKLLGVVKSAAPKVILKALVKAGATVAPPSNIIKR